MPHHNDDYLAKKIAEETIKAQRRAYEKRKIEVLRISLKGTLIICGVFLVLFLPVPILGLAMIPPFIALAFITHRFNKKYPK